MGGGAVYLDHAASTPVRPRVAEAMCDCLGPSGAQAGKARHTPGSR